jgi:uncharacterized membrane protein
MNTSLTPNSRRLTHVDALRGLAALIVLYIHVTTEAMLIST